MQAEAKARIANNNLKQLRDQQMLLGCQVDIMRRQIIADERMAALSAGLDKSRASPLSLSASFHHHRHLIRQCRHFFPKQKHKRKRKQGAETVEFKFSGTIPERLVD